MYVSTPLECSWHWAEIMCLHICFTPQPDCLWKSESQGLAHFCTFISRTWLHIHYTCTDGIMSSHRRKCSKLPGRAFMIYRNPWRATKIKRSPHCLCLSWRVSFQSLNYVWLFVTPWTAACRPPCPSTPIVYSNSCPLSWWCHPTNSSSVVSFSSHLQSFPASGLFSSSHQVAKRLEFQLQHQFFQWIFRTVFL